MILQFTTCQISRWQPLNKSCKWLLNLRKLGSQPLDVSLRCVLACGQKVRDVFDFIVEQSLGAPAASGLRHVKQPQMSKWADGICTLFLLMFGTQRRKTGENMWKHEISKHDVVLLCWSGWNMSHHIFLTEVSWAALVSCALMQVENDIRNTTWFDDEPIRAIKVINNHSAIHRLMV